VDLVSSSNWTYLVILGIAFFDALIPIVPSETAVITAGVLAGTGDLQLSLVIGAGALGAFSGDNSAYLLGRKFERPISRLVFRGKKGQERHAWAERGLDRWGGPLIFGARFVPGGRTATTVSSGVLRMHWPRFARWAGLAAITWASYAALIGYLGGKAFQDNPIWGLLLGFGIAAAVFVVVEVVRRLRVKPA
jgi:membrane protein DedA with SNARE-associated domain